MDHKPVVYTIGTGLRSFEDFIETLLSYEIQAIIDVRSYPKSKLSHFTGQTLSGLLAPNNISYYYLGRELGGLRKGGYTAYMITEEFGEGVRALERIAHEASSAILCAERFPWKCHRKWISLELQKLGWEVRHIIDKGKLWIPK